MRHINQKNVLDTDEWIGVDLELEFHEDGFEVPTNAGDEAEMYGFDNLEDFIATRALWPWVINQHACWMYSDHSNNTI